MLTLVYNQVLVLCRQRPAAMYSPTNPAPLKLSSRHYERRGTDGAGRCFYATRQVRGRGRRMRAFAKIRSEGVEQQTLNLSPSMKLKVICDVRQMGQYLPLNHQYELSSYIYHRLAAADPGFAAMLHKSGYSLTEASGRKFKFFTFSNIFVPKGQGKLRGSKLKVLARQVHFDVSFLLDRAAQHFIVGTFMNNHFGIGNRDGVLDLHVTGVQSLPEPEFDSGQLVLGAISPVVVSRPVDTRDGRIGHDYLNPENDGDYEFYFIQNLLRKYDTARRHEFVEGGQVAPHEVKLTVDRGGGVRRKPRIIKLGKPGEIRIIGYQYRFTVQAPPAVLRVGYLSGWGGQNAQGFGMAKVLVDIAGDQ